MARNLINAAHIKAMKPKPGCKLTKYHDGEGLYLWVYDDGAKNYKRWFFRFRINGVNKPEMLLGSWPDVQAAEARAKAEEARQLLKQGIDPAENRKATKAAERSKESNSFEVVAREWFAIKTAEMNEQHRGKVVDVANAAAKQISLFASQFGMSPSTRSGVSVKAPEKENPLAKFKKKW
ncbi:hypothetical protein MASR1M12_05770 [Erysipelotrichia bacterium]|jgi:hypothetical protein